MTRKTTLDMLSCRHILSTIPGARDKKSIQNLKDVKQMYHRKITILVITLTVLVLIVSACASPKVSDSKPFPDLKEWDLLIVSSSTNWGVGQYYASLIEKDMNVKVNLHDCWVGGLDIGVALKNLRNNWSWSSYVNDQSCYKPLSDLVKDAEVMVLFGGPFASSPGEGSWDISESWKACIQGGYAGKNLLPEFDAYKDKMLKSCAPETWSKFQADLGSFLDEIDKIRDGRPLILRLTTAYNPLHASYRENGVDEVCTKCSSYISEAIYQVAEQHGVPVADTMIALNGKDYTSEIPAEYIGSDGVHPSDAGTQFIATLLQQTGYAYAGK